MTMRHLFIVSSAAALMLASACDSGDDAPGRDIPHTIPPARATLPVDAQRPTPAVPLRKVRIQGTGPIYET